MNNEGNDYLQIPVNIFKDRRLKAQDIAMLTSFFFLLKKDDRELKFKISKVLNRLGITRNQFEFTIKRLERFNWIRNVHREERDSSIEMNINIPQFNQDPYKQPGSMIAKSWNKYFGNRMIKYEDVQEFKKFVLDGMEEELVLKIMEYSGLRAEGSPFHYAKAVLLDLHSRGILTIDDFEEQERKGGSYYGQDVSKNNRGKEKRDEDEVAKEYYKKGYR